MRMQQSAIEPNGFAQRGAFRTQPAEIGWMFGIARDG
jgi:hypothetical protein